MIRKMNHNYDDDSDEDDDDRNDGNNNKVNFDTHYFLIPNKLTQYNNHVVLAPFNVSNLQFNPLNVDPTGINYHTSMCESTMLPTL